MAIPYKCLVAHNITDASDGGSSPVLFGTSGSKIVAQSINGTASIWPEQDAQSGVSVSL